MRLALRQPHHDATLSSGARPLRSSSPALPLMDRRRRKAVSAGRCATPEQSSLRSSRLQDRHAGQ